MREAKKLQREADEQVNLLRDIQSIEQDFQQQIKSKVKELEGKIREEQQKVSKTIGGEVIISDEEEEEGDNDDEEEVHNLFTDTSDKKDMLFTNKSKTSVNDNLGFSRQITGVGLLKQPNTANIEKQTR